MNDVILDDSLLNLLDPDQIRGVLAGEGLVPISAGAGTGKTRVLMTRIVRLVREGVDPARITAVTFTNKAAIEMRERAHAMAGSEVAGVRFSTLHALSSRILRRHWHVAGLAGPDFGIADDGEVDRVLAEAMIASGALEPGVDGQEREYAAARRETARHCLKRISGWKERGLTVAEVLRPGRERRSEGDEAAAECYVAYQSGMAMRNLVDFADLTMLATHVLATDPAILAEEAARITWMMVDEFQDTNPSQMKFLALLCSQGTNLTAVGDDDQSIYAFRGAVPNLMERVEEFFPEVARRGVTRVSLVTNRRCTENILAPANMLVDYNRRDQPKVLQSGRQGEDVTVAGHASADAEAEDVARGIAALIAQGTPPGEIAVLTRVGDILTGISAALARQRVPHSVQAGTSFLERSEVMDVMAYLKLAINPSLDLAFRRIHARPTRGIGTSAAEAVLLHAKSSRAPIHESLLALAAAGGLKGEARAGAARLSRHLSALSEAYGAAESSEAIVRYVLADVGYSDWAWGQSEPPKHLRSSIDHLIGNAASQPDFLTFLEDCSLMGIQEERAEGAVHLGTLHGSKGLEWDHVFLPAFEEGILPSPRALEEAAAATGALGDPWCVESRGGMEEERRLAHVGMTRARHGAHLSFALRRRKFGRDQDAKPSRFLREAELPVPRVTQSFAAGKAARKGKSPANRSFF